MATEKAVPAEAGLDDLRGALRAFARARDWEQFHTPKNLAMALAVEAAELMEIFQWLTIDESRKASLSPSQLKAVEEEIADVMIYAVRMAQVLDIDLLKAVADKISKNNAKYPVDKIKGKATLD